eukprot:m.47101 g.47101  ORF g.47101 m.47101 type:complete len:372 (+) comp10447_c0_seq2:175-1290(+)
MLLIACLCGYFLLSSDGLEYSNNEVQLKRERRIGEVLANCGNVKASGLCSVASGSGTTASAFASTALGASCTATGGYSIALGRNANASGDHSTSIGQGNTASGYNSIAFGGGCIASNQYSVAMGRETKASGAHSVAMGRDSVASDYASTAIGFRSVASVAFSTAIGYFTNASTVYETVVGTHNKLTREHNQLFTVGNGDHTTRSDAFYVTDTGDAFVLKNLFVSGKNLLQEIDELQKSTEDTIANILNDISELRNTSNSIVEEITDVRRDIGSIQFIMKETTDSLSASFGMINDLEGTIADIVTYNISQLESDNNDLKRDNVLLKHTIATLQANYTTLLHMIEDLKKPCVCEEEHGCRPRYIYVYMYICRL